MLSLISPREDLFCFCICIITALYPGPYLPVKGTLDNRCGWGGKVIEKVRSGDVF